jgi:8-oxo-dGTP diphosphatase
MKIHPDVEAVLGPLQETADADGIEARVVGAVIWQRDTVLVLKRTLKTQFLPGYGDIPGGYALRDETILEALARETKEETGLTIATVERYLGSFDYQSARGLRSRQFNFETSVTGRGVQLMPDEHSDHAWCDPRDQDALRSQRLSPELKRVIQSAAEARWGRTP